MGIYFSTLSEHPDGGAVLVGGMTEHGLSSLIFALDYTSEFIISIQKIICKE